MNGSKKQIAWAEKIKAEYINKLPDMSANPVAEKARQYLLSIEDANFWIDEAKEWTGNPLGLLRNLIGKSGLAIRGFSFSDRAHMDPKTGEINITNRR